MTYRLVRTLPNGTEREHTGLKSMRDVGAAVFYTLTDNTGLDRVSAVRIAEEVESANGSRIVSGAGYLFRVERESGGGAA